MRDRLTTASMVGPALVLFVVMLVVPVGLSIYLSLTDASGVLVVRRMLSPAEMQAGRVALPAGADQQLQLVFDSGAQKISGYSVELFYP